MNLLVWILKTLLFVKGWIHTHFVADIQQLNEIKNIGIKSTSMDESTVPQILEPMHFYIEDLQSDADKMKQAQDLIFNSIPIKLSFKQQSNESSSFNAFNDYNQYFIANKVLGNSMNSTQTGLLRRYWNQFDPNRFKEDFSVFAMNLLNEYPIYLLEFSGRYTAGGLHSDLAAGSLFGCYNFYHIKKGAKKAIILPPEAMKYIDLKYRLDSIIPEQEGLSDDKCLKNVPYFYEFELREGQFVLFNNCDSMHKFENIDVTKYGYYPIAYSLRLSNRKRKQFDIARTNYHIMIKAEEFASIMSEQLLAINDVKDQRAY